MVFFNIGNLSANIILANTPLLRREYHEWEVKVKGVAKNKNFGK
jgi:hypothetical protein